MTEAEIDRLRLAAFKTNSNEDKAAYYLAVSKWFQERQYRDLTATDRLRNLTARAENFWAFLQGEYGVRLSSESQEDHNVSGFFDELEKANAFLSAS